MKQTEQGFLSGAVLKTIACISMLIDHFSAIVLWAYVRQSAEAGNPNIQLKNLYNGGRAIGRIAFVLFAYLLVEGFRYTRSRGRFLLRLGIFALLSEIPYDLAFEGKWLEGSSQNVFFTLFLGLLALTLWEWGGRRGSVWRQYGAVALCALAAYYLRTDYQYIGVLLIFVLYLTHDVGLPWQMTASGVVLLLGTWSANCLRYGESYSLSYLFQFSLREMYGMAAFVPIAFYDGSRGKQLPKWFWYGFYPIHLLLLYGISRAFLSG
ncbi:MAG: conjugal transfer protein TraX [Clostridiales bacterium]|nr:conjugal transfer protein TraX [Clostridiales bacterium]